MKFADFYPGQIFECGDYAVTEHDIVEFARQFDPQPFHTDKTAATATRWQGLIGSGFHTCSIAMRLVVDHILHGSESIGSPGLDYVKWPNPVHGGDRLRLRARVLEARPAKSGRVGVVRWEWVLLNQNDRPVLDLVAISLFALTGASGH